MNDVASGKYTIDTPKCVYLAPRSFKCLSKQEVIRIAVAVAASR
jgi:hypothetical protein